MIFSGVYSFYFIKISTFTGDLAVAPLFNCLRIPTIALSQSGQFSLRSIHRQLNANGWNVG
jgi:hypothetical protein